MDKPIIILGAARSGTTLMAETILAKHPAVAYWNEPRVWRYGHAYRMSDVLRREDATPKVKAFLQKRFDDYLEASGRDRFMEKHPSNCFRMPFVLEIFPDARVVHIIRDGREVALSAAKDWAGTGHEALDSRQLREAPRPTRIWKTLLKRLRLSDHVTDLTTLLELPAYAPRFAGFLLRQGFRNSMMPWGPRFPGISAVRRTYSLLETCAIQWDLSVRVARSACQSLPPHQYMELRYEDLLSEPQHHVSRVLEFASLSASMDTIESLTRGVVRRDSLKWPHQLSAAEVEGVEALTASTLLELGYPLARAAARQSISSTFRDVLA